MCKLNVRIAYTHAGNSSFFSAALKEERVRDILRNADLKFNLQKGAVESAAVDGIAWHGSKQATHSSPSSTIRIPEAYGTEMRREASPIRG